MKRVRSGEQGNERMDEMRDVERAGVLLVMFFLSLSLYLLAIQHGATQQGNDSNHLQDTYGGRKRKREEEEEEKERDVKINTRVIEHKRCHKP